MAFYGLDVSLRYVSIARRKRDQGLSVLAARKPDRLFRATDVAQTRWAERRSAGCELQEPPRRTRALSAWVWWLRFACWRCWQSSVSLFSSFVTPLGAPSGRHHSVGATKMRAWHSSSAPTPEGRADARQRRLCAGKRHAD